MADEYESLNNSFSSKKTKGYGAAIPSSSSSHQPKPVIVTHQVVKSDSLTSLAIHYNSTVADIKRANKLWNNQSLGFRDTIEIPVYDSQATGENDSMTASSNQVTISVAGTSDIGQATANGTDITNDEFFSNFDKSVSLTSNSSGTTNGALIIHKDISRQTNSTDTISNGPGTADGHDFFAKYDQSLSVLKKKVESAGASR